MNYTPWYYICTIFVDYGKILNNYQPKSSLWRNFKTFILIICVLFALASTVNHPTTGCWARQC